MAGWISGHKSAEDWALRWSGIKVFLPAAKPAGLRFANVKLLVDTWLLGALDAFRDMLAQACELAGIKYDVS